MGSFNFKDLLVWQKAMTYSEEVSDLTERIRLAKKFYRAINQLDDSSFSVHSNIAEGKGRYSKKEFIYFLRVARGSLYESVSQLIFFNRKKLISDDELNKLETDANEIAKMLNALINSIERSIN